MIAKLILTSQENPARQEFILDKPRITIGRKPGNELHFNRPEISGTHASFTFENGKHFVTDLGSTNGTLLNGAQLLANEKYALQPNDVVTIAPYRMTYVLEEESLETMIEVPKSQKEPGAKAVSGTLMDGVIKVSTGTAEHEKKKTAPPPEPKEPVKEAVAPPPPPAAEPPPPEPKIAPPPPPQEPGRPDPQSVPIKKQSSLMDYVWIGIGILVFLAAVGLILLLALTI